MEEQRKYVERTKHLAGVFCDICETELHYAEPDMVNLSYPPSKWVFCPNRFCPDHKERKLMTVW